MGSVGPPVTVDMLCTCTWYLCSVNSTLFVHWQGMRLPTYKPWGYVYVTYHYACPKVPKYKMMYRTVVHLKECSYSHFAIQLMYTVSV